MNRFTIGLLSVVLAASVTACSGQQGQRTTPSGTASRTVTSSVTGTGTKGGAKFTRTTQTLGKWKVTVMTMAMKPSKATTPAVPARVSAVVSVKNTGTGSMKMYRSDWTLVKSTGGTITPVNKGQTSVTVQPGKHKTMALVFQVPTTTGVTYMLRFQPKQGGPGAIEVAVP